MISPLRFFPGLILAVVALGLFATLGLQTSLMVVQAAQAQVVSTGEWARVPEKRSTFKVAPGGSEVFDREGLMQIRSFCVSTRHLEGPEAAAVNEFLATEGQPGKLLSRLPWSLTNDCTKADAVARIYLDPVELAEVETIEDRVHNQPRPKQSTRFQPVLLVYDKASIRLFYRAEGKVLRGNSADVLGSPFAMLLKDLGGRGR